jgi:hypothetical protein
MNKMNEVNTDKYSDTKVVLKLTDQALGTNKCDPQQYIRQLHIVHICEPVMCWMIFIACMLQRTRTRCRCSSTPREGEGRAQTGKKSGPSASETIGRCLILCGTQGLKNRYCSGFQNRQNRSDLPRFFPNRSV